MNTMDNARVIEAIEKFTIFSYFEKLLNAKMHKVVLFSVFPYTAAPNLSDPHSLILIDDPEKIAALNSGRFDN